MISVIVCSNKPPEWTIHERNVSKTIGAAYEYLRIDNRNGAQGICAAYNRGAARAKGDVLVFVHEDVFFLEHGWGRVLERKFGTDASIGLIGVAGTQYLYRDKMAWCAAGRPYVRGRVVHELDNGNEYFMTVFDLDKCDSEVVAVDGLFFALRRELYPTVRFDETTFDGFHFYDLDISMQVRAAGKKCIVTWDIMVKHLSAGNADKAWREYGTRFLLKYRDVLPVWSTPRIPDLSGERIAGQNLDLLGRAPQATII